MHVFIAITFFIRLTSFSFLFNIAARANVFLEMHHNLLSLSLLGSELNTFFNFEEKARYFFFLDFPIIVM